MSCGTKLYTITGGAAGGGPYLVTPETPNVGDNTVTDTSSGNTFIIPAPVMTSYSQSFITNDWIVGATDSTLTINTTVHEQGINPTVNVYENNELVQVDTLTIDNLGNVVLSVPNFLTFDGEIVITV